MGISRKRRESLKEYENRKNPYTQTQKKRQIIEERRFGEFGTKRRRGDAAGHPSVGICFERMAEQGLKEWQED